MRDLLKVYPTEAVGTVDYIGIQRVRGKYPSFSALHFRLLPSVVMTLFCPAVKSYKCDTCKKIIMDTYIEEEA